MIIDRIELADITKPHLMASAVLKQVRVQHNGILPIPVPIEDIAYAADISSISPIEISGFQGALIITDGGSIGHILKNANNSGVRQRFTVGHELGHWLLPWHTIQTKELYCTQAQMTKDFTKGISPAERIEVEANLFSSEILLPEKEFKADLGSFGEPNFRSILSLAQKYDVSKLATVKRYTALNGYSCAVVTSKDLIIQSIYRGNEFPNLDLKKDYPIPPRSHTAILKKSAGHYSDLLPTKWENWLKNQPHAKAELLEQVLYQADGYMMTLLYLDTKACPDEDEEYVERTSVWDPRFR